MKRVLFLLPLLLLSPGCGERKSASEVVAEMVRTYQQAKSFTDTSTEDVSVRSPGQPQQLKMEHRVAYEAPNRFYFDSRAQGQAIQVLASDGSHVRSLDAQSGVVQESAAPARLAGSLQALERFGLQAKNNPLAYIAGYDPLAGAEAEFAEGEQLEGQPAHIVLLKGGAGPPVTLWVGKEDYLLYRVRQLIPAQMSRLGVEVETSDRRSDVKLNGPVAADLLAFSAPSGSRVMQVTYPGAPCPPVTLKDLDGRSHSLSELKGKVVVLNFWAFWCGPCRQELPTLQKLSAELRSKDVVFLGVTSPDSRDPKWSETRGVLRQAGVTYPSLVDTTSELFAAFGADGLPHTAVIDRSGIVSASFAGLRPEAELREALTKAGG